MRIPVIFILIMIVWAVHINQRYLLPRDNTQMSFKRKFKYTLQISIIFLSYAKKKSWPNKERRWRRTPPTLFSQRYSANLKVLLSKPRLSKNGNFRKMKKLTESFRRFSRKWKMKFSLKSNKSTATSVNPWVFPPTSPSRRRPNLVALSWWSSMAPTALTRAFSIPALCPTWSPPTSSAPTANSKKWRTFCKSYKDLWVKLSKLRPFFYNFSIILGL